MFSSYGFPLHVVTDILPQDDTTLFVCSGMQNLKGRFKGTDGSVYGSLQSCVRTNDIGLVGDGTHLTSFSMLGNFSFAGPPYAVSVAMWRDILKDLGVPVDCVHVHPEGGHHRLWDGLPVVEDPECVWTDGGVGGYCCEVYSGGVEIGNLVNPLGHSTDVGFGFERLVAALEGCRADESSLFDASLSPVCRDHVRTLGLFWDCGVAPGNKGRNYVCRRLLRRVLSEVGDVRFRAWVDSERVLVDKALSWARRMWRRHHDKPPEWWWGTCGVTEEDLQRVRN